MSKARLVLTALFVDRQTPAEVATRYGVHRCWVYKLKARHQADGDAAFEPRSRRPKTSPTAIPPATVALIVELRERSPPRAWTPDRTPSPGTWPTTTPPPCRRPPSAATGPAPGWSPQRRPSDPSRPTSAWRPPCPTRPGNPTSPTTGSPNRAARPDPTPRS